MNKATAEKLLIFVNDEICYSAFQTYLQEEQDKILTRMMASEDTNVVTRCQGSYNTLEMLKSIKQKVLSYER